MLSISLILFPQFKGMRMKILRGPYKGQLCEFRQILADDEFRVALQIKSKMIRVKKDDLKLVEGALQREIDEFQKRWELGWTKHEAERKEMLALPVGFFYTVLQHDLCWPGKFHQENISIPHKLKPPPKPNLPNQSFPGPLRSTIAGRPRRRRGPPPILHSRPGLAGRR